MRNRIAGILVGVLLISACNKTESDRSDPSNTGLSTAQSNLRQQVNDAEIVCVNNVQYMDVGRGEYSLVVLYNQNGPLRCQDSISKGLFEDPANKPAIVEQRQ